MAWTWADKATTTISYTIVMGPSPFPAVDETYYNAYPVLAWRALYLRAKPEGFIGARAHAWTHSFYRATCIPREIKYQEYLGIPAGYPVRPACLEWDCACGIYAYKDWTKAFNGVLLCLVALEDVLEYTEGYRAARAWMLAAFSPKQNPKHELTARLLRELAPPVPLCNSVKKIKKVADYYAKNPERIPTWDKLVSPSDASNP